MFRRAGDVLEIALARLSDVDQLHVAFVEQALQLLDVDGGQRLRRVGLQHVARDVEQPDRPELPGRLVRLLG